MTDVILQTMRYVRDLLGLPESQIKDGRSNYNQEDPTLLLVVVDSLSEEKLGTSRTFKGDEPTQVESINSMERASVTINFYGDDALAEAQRFQAFSISQRGADAASGKGLTVGYPSAPINLKNLTGDRYTNRYEVSCEVMYNSNIDVETPSFVDVNLDSILFEE